MAKKVHKSSLHKAQEKYNAALIEETDAKKHRKDTELEYINTCIDEYREEQDREQLIQYGRKFCYSKQKLDDIEKHFKAWNMDEVNIILVEDILDLEIFVEKRSTTTVLGKIKNVFHEKEGE